MRPSLRMLSLVAALLVFWLLLSGHFTPFLVGAGVLTAVGVALLGRRMGYAGQEGHPVEFLLRGFLYWPWLAREIWKSALDVSRIVLDPKLPISAAMVRVRPSQKTAVGIVTYANSITLTPGTITVGCQGDGEELVVHALTRAAAEGLAGGEMDARVTAFEGTAP